MSSRRLLLAVLLLCSAATLSAQSVRNWSAPPRWAPPRTGFGARVVQGDISNLLPFVAISPCRMLDTRITGGAIVSGTTRNVVLTGAPCGIPTAARAVSANFAVFDITGTTQNGVLLVYPTGSPSNSQAMVNWAPTSGQLDNASVVPLGNGGAITVQPNQGAGTINLVIDVNGYYSETPALLSDPLQVINASHYAIYGQVFGSGVNDAGVFGWATSLTGVTDGVFGQSESSSDFAAGVLALNTATTGMTFGVFGRTSSNNDRSAGLPKGVYGEAVGTFGIGVMGVQTGTPIPPSAYNDFRYGVFGSGTTGVRGYSNGGSTNGFLGVLGTEVSPTGTGEGVLGYHATFDYGVYSFSGPIGCGGCTKQFVEPHPTDPSKSIHYASLEGPEAGTYFRGTAHTIHGDATIDIPDHFRWVTQEQGMTVQLTPIGDLAMMAVVSQDLNRIVVRSSKDVSFHYLVQGIRPSHRDFQPVMTGNDFAPRSASDRLNDSLPALIRQRLVENRTYNSDGTVNMETAERLGWTKEWSDREARARAAVEARRAAEAGR